MPKKKDLPLAILKALESFVNLKGEKFEVIAPRDALIHVVDKEPDSSFQFVIEKYQYDSSNSRFACLMTKCPNSTTDTGIQKNWINITSLTDEFNGWLKLLEEYDTIPSFFDDPILEAFQEEYYAEFEIIDEDAETKPLNTKQILFLGDYLEELDKKLEGFITKENENDISEIKSEILLLQNNLTNKPKKWVANKIATVWAKITKLGVKLMKELLPEAKKQIVAESVKGVFLLAKENIQDLFN